MVRGSRLSESGAALFANDLVDIFAEIFFAGGAPPVKGAETDERGDDYDLRCKDGVF